MDAKNLFAAVQSFLETESLSYDSCEDSCYLQTDIILESKLRNCRTAILVKDGCIEVTGTVPVRVSEDVQGAAAEFLNLLNYYPDYGKFMFMPDDGEIDYRVAATFRGETPPDHDQLEELIYMPARMFEQYGDALLRVLYGLNTPMEAMRCI